MLRPCRAASTVQYSAWLTNRNTVPATIDLSLPPGAWYSTVSPGQATLQPNQTVPVTVTVEIGREASEWLWQGDILHAVSPSVGYTAYTSFMTYAHANCYIDASWDFVAQPATARSRTAAAAVGHALYLVGGESTAGREAHVEKYDPTANTWSTQAGLMPAPVSNSCAAAIGTDIYVPGGFTAASAPISDLQVYHTSSDTWETVTSDPLPVTLITHSCASLNSKLYVFGGSNQSSATSTVNTVYVYDPGAQAGHRWSTLTPMPTARTYTAAAVVGSKIYVAGGWNDLSQPVQVVEAYDPASNIWETLPPMPLALRAPGAYGIGQKLMVCGGELSPGFSSYCIFYDVSPSALPFWRYIPGLKIGRRTFAYAALDGALYAVDGYNGSYMPNAEKVPFSTCPDPVHDLAVTITHTPESIRVLQPVGYQIQVANSGFAYADNVTLAVTLPAGAAFQSYAASQGTCTPPAPGSSSASCSLGTLHNGSTASISLALLAPSIPAAGSLQVVVQGGLPDPNPANNTAIHTITFTPMTLYLPAVMKR